MEYNQECIFFNMVFRFVCYIIYPILPLMIYIISCNTKKSSQITSQKHIALAKTAYTNVKATIKSEKQKFITNKILLPRDRQLIADKYISLFTEKMVPAWLGTKWNFNGTTQTPKIGNVACGYFVTTTMQDMQFPIERVKYAQCASQQTLEHLAQKAYVQIYNKLSFDQFINKLQTHHNFLGIVGLDNHIGYIVKKDKELNFIHSGVRYNGVKVEKAANCTDLKNSKWRSVAYLTDDISFLKKWIDFK